METKRSIETGSEKIEAPGKKASVKGGFRVEGWGFRGRLFNTIFHQKSGHGFNDSSKGLSILCATKVHSIRVTSLVGCCGGQP